MLCNLFVDDYLKDEESDDTNSIVNNVRKFRKEFKETLKDDGIENVIVLIDDLDRCNQIRNMNFGSLLSSFVP